MLVANDEANIALVVGLYLQITMAFFVDCLGTKGRGDDEGRNASEQRPSLLSPIFF